MSVIKQNTYPWYIIHLSINVFPCISCRLYEKKKKAYERMEEQLTKLEVQATDKDENKEIALGTSKLNYLDPRISVAWYVLLCDKTWWFPVW